MHDNYMEIPASFVRGDPMAADEDVRAFVRSLSLNPSERYMITVARGPGEWGESDQIRIWKGFPFKLTPGHVDSAGGSLVGSISVKGSERKLPTIQVVKVIQEALRPLFQDTIDLVYAVEGMNISFILCGSFS